MRQSYELRNKVNPGFRQYPVEFTRSRKLTEIFNNHRKCIALEKSRDVKRQHFFCAAKMQADRNDGKPSSADLDDRKTVGGLRGIAQVVAEMLPTGNELVEKLSIWLQLEASRHVSLHQPVPPFRVRKGF